MDDEHDDFVDFILDEGERVTKDVRRGLGRRLRRHGISGWTLSSALSGGAADVGSALIGAVGVTHLGLDFDPRKDPP